MKKYLALMRGINVGGKNIVPMATVKRLFADLGFKNVKTILASGNVVFDAETASPAKLRTQIEEVLENEFKRHIHVIVCTMADLERIVSNEPFKKSKVTPQTRLYVTFLSTKPASLKPPRQVDPAFKILKVTDSIVCSVLELSAERNTIDLMDVIEKTYGHDVTTRNWNTVLKIVSAANS